MDAALTQYVLSYGGAAGLCLVLILLGVLVPKPYHDREVKELRERNSTLTAANDELRSAAADLRQQNSRLAETGQLNNNLVTALIEITNERRPARRPEKGT